MLSALCVFRLLGDEAGDCLLLPTLPKDSLPIEKNPEIFEVLEKFIRFQKIFGILRPSGAEFPLLKEVGLEDHHPSFS